MWPIAVMVVMTAIVGLFQVHYESAPTSDFQALTTRSMATNMLVYKGAVDTYVASKAAGYTEASPGNTVPDASLAFPTWYIRNPLWTNKVIGGKVTVYATSKPTQGDISAMLAKATRGSRSAGVVATSTNTILSPLYGDTGIAIPAGLPNGVPVLNSRIN